MSVQGRLFRLAPIAFMASAVHTPGEGWHLTVQMRRDGGPWSDSDRIYYDGLSTQELIDVLCAEVEGQLS